MFGCFLIGGFVVQSIVALLDLKSGSVAGGNTFLFFCAYCMLASGLEMFIKFFVPGIATRIDAWCWMVLAASLILWTPAFLKSVALLFYLVVNGTYGRKVFPNPAPLYKGK